MAYDSIANASIPTAASNPKDFAKKKRANRSAKLKQVKLDVRREQWLSQVKNKGAKEEFNGVGVVNSPLRHAHNERKTSVENLVINPEREENDGLMHQYSDSDSASNSPTSHASSVSGSHGSGANFTGSSSSSSSSGGCCSGSITEEDEEDDCLDDWEAIADALAATDDKQEQHNPNLESPPEHENASNVNSLPQGRNSANSRAWRPDDAFRPQILPNLLKQHSFPMNSERNYGHGAIAWGCKNAVSPPSSCPICCEDLDLTDSSFLPCLCGFRLCLFCHKRILEEDGRCPGCRKQYECDGAEREVTLDGSSLTFRLPRSCSMITRS